MVDNDSPIISVSGLRGVVGSSLTPLTVTRYVAAYAEWLTATQTGSERPRVVVGRDGRPSGPMLMHAVVSTLTACGIDPLIADLAATPTLGVLVRANAAAGGVQISASHNPPPYNGLKLFGADGRVIPAASGGQVLEHYQASRFPWKNHASLGQAESLADTTSRHLELVLSTVDVERIRASRFRVVLDSNHASGSVLGGRLLEALGCDYTIVGAEPTGEFANKPEPTAENLAEVTRLAGEYQAQVVFCQDPDADRLAVIDEQGRYIGEEYTLALTLFHALRQRQDQGEPLGPVVTNCSSSRMTKDIAEQFQVPCLLSKVGEANVTDQMIASQAVYGGEGSGGPIDPRVGYVRDSFVGMAQILDAMAARKASVSELVAELPSYSIRKSTIQLPDRLPQAQAISQLFDRLESEATAAEVSRLDGLRIDWPNGWLLVRPSNTEPIVRAVAEAQDPEQAEAWCRWAASAADSIG